MARHPRRSPGLTIYLARHGQTEWNATGRRQGRLDSPLTALGLDQAHRNAQLLTGEGIDAVFASPLGRARRTASIIASELGLTVQVVDDLAEVDHGLWSGLGSAEIDAGWPGQRAVRERDKYTFRFPEGESYADANVRAGQVLGAIARSGVRRPLVVSHEMIGRMLLRQLGVPDALGTRQPSDVVYRVRDDGLVDRISAG
ncbi:histidine phosphatase family protein [Kribbella shirazensis]|uniref:Putative phosphoglycerate mutase n=1 Tax=Kribbella shirazensis TaxID=1105143 RepID=A0A7X5ZZU7_9ACTN|nr:histidine phosphatase family protein [Kribbella shirazensis]NIK56432.1 putative phosphoglycerate mutase [Kribbella shirazensis]